MKMRVETTETRVNVHATAFVMRDGIEIEVKDHIGTVKPDILRRMARMFIDAADAHEREYPSV